jgi:hypothetical protein
MTDTDQAASPDALFVIACPACLGTMSATARIAGAAACCPLCAAPFLVPAVHRAPPPVAAADSRPAGPAIETGPSPADDAFAGLLVCKPATTAGRGDRAGDLRRLSAAERRMRRTRRNIVCLLVGAAVLVTMVVLLGMPGRGR